MQRNNVHKANRKPGRNGRILFFRKKNRAVRAFLREAVA